MRLSGPVVRWFVLLSLLFACVCAGRPAVADVCDIDAATGRCAVSASDGLYLPPGATYTSGSHHKSGRPICYDRHLKQGSSRWVVACDGADGSWWSNDLACWAKPMADPPLMTDPVWEGHTDGGIYQCQPATGDGVSVGVPTMRLIWLVAAPQRLVDPELLAFRALKVMGLRRAGVGTTPSAGRAGVVGLPTYLWITDPGPSVTGPQTRTATAGAVSVTGTAKVLSMKWSLGNGRNVTCATAGTPYRNSFGSRPSPTCGYTFTAPGSYAISLTTRWRFEWAGGGQNGSYEFSFTTPTAIRMQEVQVLN
jgi:hypothetical protein